jgi:hypothetical protein
MHYVNDFHDIALEPLTEILNVVKNNIVGSSTQPNEPRSLPVGVQRARFADATNVFLATLNAHHEGATSMVKSVCADIILYIEFPLHGIR